MVRLSGEVQMSPVPYHTLRTGVLEVQAESVGDASNLLALQLRAAYDRVFDDFIGEMVASSEMSEALKKGKKAIIGRGKDGKLTVDLR